MQAFWLAPVHGLWPALLPKPMTLIPLQSIQPPGLLQERLDRLKTDFPDLFTNEFGNPLFDF